MKQPKTFRAALRWVMLCLIVGIFLMLSSDKGETVSDTENRTLQAFPKLSAKSVFSGDYMQDLESFFLDKFIARDSVIEIANDALGLFSVEKTDASDEMEQQLDAEEGGENDAADEEIDVPGIVTASSVTSSDEQTEDASQELEEDDSATESGDLEIGEEQPLSYDYSYFWVDKADGTHKKIRTFTREKVSTFADTLSTIQSFLPEDGEIFFTQVPLASTANKLMDRQDEYVGWGSTGETMLTQILEEKGLSRIHVYNTPEILEPYMTGDTPMFYRTDHHWSTEGAYYVFAEMMKDRGVPVTPYNEYQYKALESEVKDGKQDVFNCLYPLYPTVSQVITNRTEIETIDLMNYDKHTYRCLMNGSRKPWRRIISGAATGRKALVICDSFGNAFTPYLLAYYDEVHMTDFRKGYYSKNAAGGNISELIQYYGIDDVYIIVCTANDMTKDNLLVYLPGYLTY